MASDEGELHDTARAARYERGGAEEEGGVTSELPPSFPWTTDPMDHTSVGYRQEHLTRYDAFRIQFELSYKTDAMTAESVRMWRQDAHHLWSAFCVQWIAVGVCALVGRP